MIGPMTPPRLTLIADAAIALIAERGLRGLTHRAVDEEAGLPAGSTSNLARTRAALLDLALNRIVERGTGSHPLMAGGPVPDVCPRNLLAQGVAELLHGALTTGRSLTLARLELALEATRRPELRAGYDRLGARFIDTAAACWRRAARPTPWPTPDG